MRGWWRGTWRRAKETRGVRVAFGVTRLGKREGVRELEELWGALGSFVGEKFEIYEFGVSGM